MHRRSAGLGDHGRETGTWAENRRLDTLLRRAAARHADAVVRAGWVGATDV